MLNQSGVTRTRYGGGKNILIAEDKAIALPCMVSDTGVTADSEGKKIVKAGTPLAGNLQNRDTPFTVSTTGAVGVLLHPVDVTKGAQNAQVVFFGAVDVSKLESDVVTKLTTAVSGMKGIFLVK